MSRIRHGTAIAMLLVLLLAACGGGDTAEDTAQPAGEAPTDTAVEPADEATAAEEPAAEGTDAAEAPTEFQDATLVVVNNMAHLPIFTAQELGLWTECGLNVDVQTLGSGADIGAALESGQAQFGAVNAGTGVAPQRAGGLLTKLVAPYNNDATSAFYVDWIGIWGRADAGITEDPQSVIGKNVGVPGGGTPRAYLSEWLIRNDLSESDINVLTMGAPDMRTAIINGDVDIVVPWSPFGAAIENELGDNAVTVSEGEPLVLSAIGLGAIEGQVQENPEIFRCMIEGVVRAAQMIREDPEGIAPIVLSFVDGVTEQDAIDAIQRNQYDPRISVCTRHGVEVTTQQLVEAGDIEGEFTADDIVDDEMLNQVLEEHPEWVADLPPLPETVEECEGVE